MNDHAAQAGLLTTKSHYDVLDGLRGVAAISVVIFHFMEIAIPDYHHNFISHAYLAVDFFFCLSGFVIAYAYDAKLKNIGRAAFFKLRLIRLHPLVMIGTVLGLISFVFDPMNSLWLKYSDKLVWIVLASSFMIPYALVRERYFNFFHLNPPVWSLFWEYVANIVYAFVLVRVGKKVLWALVVLGALVLCYEAYRSTHLSVGWGGDNFWGGGSRVFFSFTAGILVYRSGYIIRSNMGFLLPGFLLLLSFMIPYSAMFNRIIEPLVVIFYFPLLLALGAGTTAGLRAHRLCAFFGEISYPLYMVHYPFIWLFMSWVETHKPPVQDMMLVTTIGTLLLLALAYAVLKFIDEPIRRWLKRKMVA